MSSVSNGATGGPVVTENRSARVRRLTEVRRGMIHFCWLERMAEREGAGCNSTSRLACSRASLLDAPRFPLHDLPPLPPSSHHNHQHHLSDNNLDQTNHKSFAPKTDDYLITYCLPTIRGVTMTTTPSSSQSHQQDHQHHRSTSNLTAATPLDVYVKSWDQERRSMRVRSHVRPHRAACATPAITPPASHTGPATAAGQHRLDGARTTTTTSPLSLMVVPNFQRRFSVMHASQPKQQLKINENGTVSISYQTNKFLTNCTSSKTTPTHSPRHSYNAELSGGVRPVNAT